MISSRLGRCGHARSQGWRIANRTLSEAAIGGLHFTTPLSLNDPEALTLAYARHFEALGGKILSGNAMTLEERNDGWTVKTVLAWFPRRIAWSPSVPGRRIFCAPWATRCRWA